MPLPLGSLPKSVQKPLKLQQLGRCSRLIKDPGHEDGYNVENQHRRGKQQHVGNVVGGRQNRRRDQNNNDCGFPDSRHEPGRNQSDSRQDIGYCRHLENYAHTEHHDNDEVEIVVRL